MGLVCKNCHTYNRGSKERCKKCNSALTSKNLKKCTYCKYLNPKGVKRCIKCGKKFGFFNTADMAVSGAKVFIDSFATASQHNKPTTKNPTPKPPQKVLSSNKSKKETSKNKTGVVWRDALNELQKLNNTSRKEKSFNYKKENASHKNVSKIIKSIFIFYILTLVITSFGGMISNLTSDVKEENLINEYPQKKSLNEIKVTESIKTIETNNKPEKRYFAKDVIIGENATVVKKLEWKDDNVLSYLTHKNNDFSNKEEYYYSLTTKSKALFRRESISFDYALSPDNKTIFYSQYSNSKKSLNIANYNAGNFNEIETIETGDYFSGKSELMFDNFHWVDLTTLAFMAYWNENNLGESEIYVLKIGGLPTQLTDFNEPHSYISDIDYGNSKIIFSTVENSRNYRTWIMNIDDYNNASGTRKMIASKALYNLEISPNESKVAFWEDSNILKILDIKSGIEKEFFKLEEGFSGGEIKWSENGKNIAFVASKNNLYDKILIIGYNGF